MLPPDSSAASPRSAAPSDWLPPDFRPRLSYHLVSMSGALFLLLDPLCLVAAAWLALTLGPAVPGGVGLVGAFEGDLMPAALVAAVLAAFTLYDPRFGLQASRSDGVPGLLRTHLLRFALFLLGLLALGGASGAMRSFPTAWLTSWLAGTLALTLLARALAARSLQRLQRAGLLTEVIAVVGAGQAAQRLVHALRQTRAHTVELLGVFDDGFEGAVPSAAAAQGTVDQLIELGKTRKIDWIVLALPVQAEHRLPQTLKRLKALSVPIGLCPRHLEMALVRPAVAFVGDHVPVGVLVQPPARRWDALVQAGDSMVPRWIVTVVLLALAGLGEFARHFAGFFRVAAPPRAARHSLRFDDCDLAGFTRVAASFGQRDYGYVVTPNADHLIRLHDDAAFRALYEEATYVLLDSRFVARLLGATRGIELPVCRGSDLTAALFRDVIAPDDGIVLIGGTPAQALQLVDQYGLRRLAQHVPPMGFVRDPQAVQACLEFIESHSPFRFCLLAVGSPQQEVLAQALRERGTARGLALCIGASINFITGDEQRAPPWMQRSGMEWLYRLMQDPRRMARRYLVRGPRVFGVLRGASIVLRPLAAAPAQRDDQRGSSLP